MEKSALITGASMGIGRVFAQRLAKNGYKVTAVARNESKLKALVAELGADHRYLVADLSTQQGQETVAKALGATRFDILINNAGVGTVGHFTDVSLEKQLGMLRLNCEALARFAHIYLSQARSGDALINVSSALAFVPMPGMALYSATKSFVTALSDSLWFEYKTKGIYVMGLCPGMTATDFQVNAGGRLEDLPKGLSQTPEQVVDKALAALRSRRKPTVFTGVKNVMFAGMSRLLPRKSLVSMSGGMMPPH